LKINKEIIWKKYFWIILGSAAILLRFFFGYFPSLTESVYSNGVFSLIRVIIDSTIGWLPFPFLYLVLLGLIFGLVIKLKNHISNYKSPLDSLKRIGFRLISFLFAVVFFFLVMWGFNYARPSISQSLNFTPNPLTLEELKIELERSTQEVKAIREVLALANKDAIGERYFPKKIEKRIREDVVRKLDRLGFSTAGRVRGRLLKPKGILLRFSTAGVYFPWTGESNVDGGLHPLQIPFTLAHEFAHGYGFTDEGTCNFLAYLACIESDNVFTAYSGALGYWRYVASSYRRINREDYSDFYKKLPEGVKADLIQIDEYMDRYPDIMPRLRNVTYDTFLKAQGVKEGVKSYNRVVMLVHGWNQKMRKNKH